MLTGLRDLVRYARATAFGGDVARIRGCGVGRRRYFPKILGHEIRLNLKTKLVLLLFAALFMSLGADLMVARNAAAQAGFAMSANEVAGHGNAVQGSSPAATAGAEEQLDAPFAVLDVGEGDLAHRAHRT